MLSEILAMLDGKDSMSLAEVSAALRTNQETVKAALEYLEYHGYVRRETIGECPHSCPLRAHCACAVKCASFPQRLAWKKVRS